MNLCVSVLHDKLVYWLMWDQEISKLIETSRLSYGPSDANPGRPLANDFYPKDNPPHVNQPIGLAQHGQLGADARLVKDESHAIVKQAVNQSTYPRKHSFFGN